MQRCIDQLSTIKLIANYFDNPLIGFRKKKSKRCVSFQILFIHLHELHCIHYVLTCVVRKNRAATLRSFASLH